MLDKLEDILKKYDNLEKELQSKDIASQYSEILKINKELKLLRPVVELYSERKNIVKEIEDTENLLKSEEDVGLKEYAKSCINDLNNKLSEVDEKIKIELIPKDPDDDKNVILEIHAGIGGDESGIFVGDLFRMYSRFIEIKGWKLSVISSVPSKSGGYKEIICNISGDKIYSIMKFESGVHRVQRIPETESKGRIHTSVVSVVVMPEVDDIDIKINMNEIREDTYCSTGAGGQSVNTTYSAIRLTHIPTGLVVTCQDERSQIKNREKALAVLKSRLYRMNLEKQQNEIVELKRSIVKHGDRSDKIRTYNYPQNRITDHRINLSLYNLDKVLEGNLDELITALKMADNAERLKNL